MNNQYQKTKVIATFLFFALFVFTENTLSQEISDPSSDTKNTTQAENLPVLPVVTVKGTRIAPMTGVTILDRELIGNLPARNGTINELISIVPGVQYSETSTHSFTGGEITPPGVSISGGRIYENNYTIDGFSNNSALDPGTTRTNDISVLPGHPQQFFLDPHLIEQVTVYDSNIPAEHGGFTGGLVEAETLDPVDEFWGNINYRTTRDSWTKFYIHPSDEDDFQSSEFSSKQPRFTKHDGGFSLNIPIGSDMGVLTSYQRLQSDIPLSYFGTTKDQTRVYENFFLKYGYHITNKSRIYITGSYAPYKNEYFNESSTVSKNSDYSIEGNSTSVSSKFEHETSIGTLGVDASYSHQQNEKKAPLEKFRWSLTDSIDWGSNLEGGTGPLENSQEDIQFNSHFSFQEVLTGELSHQIKIGMEAEHSKQTYDRPVTAYYYNYYSNYKDDAGNVIPEYNVVKDLPIDCNGAIACIDNEQYLPVRNVYEAGYSEASFNRYAVFLQNAMSWRKLELFPGIRISHDSYTENTNVAPRISAAFDISGNQKSIIFAGANRYYSQNLLTDKLRETRSATNLFEYRPSPEADFDTPFSVNSFFGVLWEATDLKTPYSDEVTIGFIQAILNGTLKAQYIKRQGRDELARELIVHDPDDGYKYYRFNNNGRTDHESYQITWNRAWRNHYLEINGTHQETTTSNLKYTDMVSIDKTEELIWYNGELLSYGEVPRKDFNRPTVVNLIYSGQLPFNTKFTNTTKYRDAYYRFKYVRTDDGIRVYEKEKNHSATTTDWRFSYSFLLAGNQNIVLTLDIYNVFNEKAYVTYKDDEFEIGRQYWLGMEYNF